MEYSDSIPFGDITSNFIIIESCLRDEEHNEFLQNSEHVTLLDDHLTFNLGDSFDSYEALSSRLEAHSKQSNVYYWVRDSRTVAGARMKTTTHINPKLKYYYVKYACVYGGSKHCSRGNGIRNCASVKLDCPGHITLKANCTGEHLDVISVCNHHNHTRQDSSRVRQAKRLPARLKQEVLDLLKMGIQKRRILQYIKMKSDKQLTYKDMLNWAATLKDTTKPPLLRRQILLRALKSLESGGIKKLLHKPDNSNSQNESTVTKKRKCRMKNYSAITENKQDVGESHAVNLPFDNLEYKNVDYYVTENVVVDKSVESQVNIEDGVDNSNTIIELLCKKNNERESVVKIFNHDEMVIDEDVNCEENLLNDNYTILSQNVCYLENEKNKSDSEVTLRLHSNEKQLVRGQTYALLSEDEQITLEFDNCMPQDDDNVNMKDNDIIEEYPSILTIMNDDSVLSEENSDQYLNNIIVDSEHIVSHPDIKLEAINMTNLSQDKDSNLEYSNAIDENNIQIHEETWITSDDFNCNYDDEIVESVSSENMELYKCVNCNKIELGLSEEITALRKEKESLIEETECLRNKRDDLMKEIRELQNEQSAAASNTVKLKPIMITNKLYMVKT